MYKHSEEKIKFFQDRILQWYQEHGRNFPWRKKSASNYEKIISEVLLQRTKAETVANFFPEFIKKYPSWKQLAKATESELQQTLRPLGLYKQRGSRLYRLAQKLEEKKGRFPKNRNEVEDISMMGQYITNAYELFILKKPAPLLDVNMARVLERFFGPRKKADIRHDPYLQNLAKLIIDHSQAKEINWGILDFAAVICQKRTPKCINCFLKRKCFYLQSKNP